MSSIKEHWIYHERQEAALCGQHALNNLVQAQVFSPDSLAQIAQQLDEMELTYMAKNNEGGVRSQDYLRRIEEGSGNVDEAGNFSIEVLRAALMNQYGLSLPNIRQEGVRDSMDVTDMEGFICNRSHHWFAIRKIHDRFWNLNSTLEQPQLISHFNLAAEMESLQNQGYSVFCVESGLPPPCDSASGTSRGLPQYWWKEDDLLRRKSNATTAATDPWRTVGSGQRLDGKPDAEQQSPADLTDSWNGTEGMTEDEMLQMALMASLNPQTTSPTAPTTNNINTPSIRVAVPPEPPQGMAGAVRIQFRMPDGKRVIRRFLSTDSVQVVYAFVEESSPGNAGQQLELRYGFPPKDLASERNNTIAETHLSGESIQGRYK